MVISHFRNNVLEHAPSQHESDVTFDQLLMLEENGQDQGYEHVNSMMLSTYVCDWTWLATKLTNINNSTTSIQVSINYARDRENAGVSEQPIGEPFLHGHNVVQLPRPHVDPLSITVIHPYIQQGGGILHAKVMIIEFVNVLRVIVSSANLTQSDWELLGQTIFTVDAPRISGAIATDPVSAPEGSFQDELIELLTSLGFSAPISSMSMSMADCVNF
ncbi:hypothetical protein SAMD00019534_009530 [Acytostelium subglobosum LB1]|uniref:hypothetical protein n=1 Tax=Acytostelium subglobosum LB1 TaxID=1410327 RepID=UPI0006447DDC|nr:hypothetical protein SAMD00019534_009530 [Acytostelium subglobosum LB1]GAM17778.1 hypothetical protein SAMD00019534_009530 [Acytostelium subglobosum LB1]|eukprot:XP_012758374.1 hypothetical protein SAMD00019534_009530 [Acytostelium subglobosum LB1]